jgi:hypothetical protein
MSDATISIGTFQQQHSDYGADQLLQFFQLTF